MRMKDDHLYRHGVGLILAVRNSLFACSLATCRISILVRISPCALFSAGGVADRIDRYI